MATFIPGMRCLISDRRINSVDEAVVFSAFVSNEADPLHIFSDAVIHVDAFHNHPLATAAQARYEEARRNTRPDKRHCLICGQLVVDPNDYFGVGYLIDETDHPLYLFNYAHFHRSCLANWKGMSEFIAELDKLDRSGSWKGCSLKHTIDALHSITAK